MRATVVFFVVLGLTTVLAVPFNLEPEQKFVEAVPDEPWTYLEPERKSEDFTDSKTVTALKSWFTPIYNWFSNELPNKTPTDLAKDVKSTAEKVDDWANNNYFVQGFKKHIVHPVHSWVKDTANSLKGKTFKDMYQDTKETVSTIDDKVGTWIDSTMN